VVEDGETELPAVLRLVRHKQFRAEVLSLMRILMQLLELDLESSIIEGRYDRDQSFTLKIAWRRT
jgi:hypothetical protein